VARGYTRLDNCRAILYRADKFECANFLLL